MKFRGGEICKKSRIQANLTIEESAAMLNFSPRMISFYESGTHEISESDLLEMASAYNDPLLPYNYWAANSLIAKHYGFSPIPEASFSDIALKVANGFNRIANGRERFLDMVADAKIDVKEVSEFKEISLMVEDVSQGMTFLKLITGRLKAKEKPSLRETAA